MTREFKHSVTGRSLRVAEGSRAERLAAEDANWEEVKKASAKKAAPAKKSD